MISLGLGVHGQNTAARSLYDSLGYQVMTQQMREPLLRPRLARYLQNGSRLLRQSQVGGPATTVMCAGVLGWATTRGIRDRLCVSAFLCSACRAARRPGADRSYGLWVLEA